ncbi:MAG: hypothetical protein H7Y43_07600, partial [Akkermansiaceae bacterium]|nr:hypothetical protein [Verrucomicrobiales bacterium]
MNTKKFNSMAAALLAAALFAPIQGAFGQTIGVNIVNGGSGVNEAAPDALLPEELAGAPGYIHTNWNNLGRWGSVTGLKDSNGTTNALVFNWDAVSTGSSGSAALGTADGKMMDGFIMTDWAGGPAGPLTASSVYGAAFNQKPLIYIGGLSNWLSGQGASSYKIVLYVNGWHGWFGTSEHWIQAVTGDPLNNAMVAGPDVSAHLFNADTGAFNGTYSQVSASATSVANRSVGGNFEVFSGLTNDAVLIRNSQPNGDYQTLTI